MRSPRTGLLVAAVLGAAVVAAPDRRRRLVEACKPVVNPYAGSRYEGVDLSSIRC